MNTNDELRQQLWELAYGLLSPQEVASLHARIKSDPVTARLYAEVRLQADLVADAAKVNDPTVQLQPQGAPAVIRPAPARRGSSSAAAKKSPAKGMNWLVGIAAGTLAAMLCLVLFRPTPGGDSLAERFVVTTVEVPPHLQAGISQQVSVYTTDVDSIAKPADVEVRLLDASGQQRLRRSVRTGPDGHASVELPGQAIEPGVQLEVAAITQQERSSETESLRAVQPVTIDAEVVAEPVERYVLLDKPAYAPGDTVRYATAGVTRFSKQLVQAGDKLQDIKANAVEEPQAALKMATPHLWFYAGEVQLPNDSDSSETPAAAKSRLLQGRALRRETDELYFFNDLAKALPDLATSPAAGERMAGTERLDDHRLARGGAALGRAKMLANGQEQPQETVAAAKPKEPKGPLAASAGSAGTAGKERARELAGVEALVDAERLYAFDVVAAGKPIEVPVPAESPSRLLLTLNCAGRVVARERFSLPEAAQHKQLDPDAERVAASREMAEDKRPAIELSAGREVDGEILVSVYDDTQHPPQLVAEHRYFRQPEERLQLSLKGLQEAYAPGETVRLLVQVVDEASKPVDATVAVRVWNERLIQAAGAPVADLASSVLHRRLGRAQPNRDSLLAQADDNREFRFDTSGSAVPDLDMTDPAPSDPASKSLALGDMHAAQDAGEKDVHLFLGEALAEPIEASNVGEVTAAYQAALTALQREAAERKTAIGRLLLLGGIAVLVLLGMQALLRTSAKTSVWLPAAALAAASLIVGVVWLNPDFRTGETLETAAVPEQKPGAAPTNPSAGAEAFPLDQTPPADSASESDFFSQPEEAHLRDRRIVQLEQSEAMSDRKNLPSLLKPDAKQSREGAKEFDRQPADAPSQPAEDAPASTSPTAPAPPSAAGSNAPALQQNRGLAESAGASPSSDAAPAMTAPRPLRRMESASPSPSRSDDGSARSAGGEAELRRESTERFGARGEPSPSASASPTPGLESAAGASRDAVAGRAAIRSATGNLDEVRRSADAPNGVAASGAQNAAPLADRARSTGNRSGEMKDQAEQAARQQIGDAEGAELARAPKGDSASIAGMAGAKKSERALSRRATGPTGRDELAPSETPGSTPAALLFAPALATDSQGQVAIEFTLPDVDCEYRVLVDAIGHGRIGSLQQVIVGRTETSAQEQR